MKTGQKMAIVGTVLVVLTISALFTGLYLTGSLASLRPPWMSSTTISNNNSPPAGASPCGPNQVWVPNGTPQCQVPSSPGSTPACSAGQVTGPAIAEAGAADGMNKSALTSATNFYIFSADHINLVDSWAIAAQVSVGHVPITPGIPYAFELEATNNYPAWFTLHAGWTNCSPIYSVEAGMGSMGYNTPYGPAATASANTPLGQTLDVAVGQVVYVPGNTPYWYLQGSSQGYFLMFHRESSAHVAYAIDSPTTRSVKTATGASATGGTPFAGTQTGTYTASSQSWSINLNVQISDYSVVYGYPFMYYSALPSPVLRIGYLAMWAGYNNTNTAFAQAIMQSTPSTACAIGNYQAATWCPVLANTPGYQSFVQIVTPLESTPTSTGIANFQWAVNTGSLNGQSTKVAAVAWMADVQSINVFSATVADSAPSGSTVYAPVANYGITTTIYANGFTTSSNAPSGVLTYLPFLT